MRILKQTKKKGNFPLNHSPMHQLNISWTIKISDLAEKHLPPLLTGVITARQILQQTFKRLWHTVTLGAHYFASRPSIKKLETKLGFLRLRIALNCSPFLVNSENTSWGLACLNERRLWKWNKARRLLNSSGGLCKEENFRLLHIHRKDF